jgi:hypothetical protein
MKTSPWNRKLHKYLMANRYKYTQHYRYDRYDKGKITIFYYINNYIMILEGGEPASKEIVREIENVL